MITHEETCGCKTGLDKRGCEWIQMCPECKAAFKSRHDEFVEARLAKTSKEVAHDSNPR